MDFDDVRDKLVQATMLAERANALSGEQRSNLKYQVSLQVPIQCLNQAKRVSYSKGVFVALEMKRFISN